MTIQEIVAAVKGEILIASPFEIDLKCAFASDLMSDVLTLAEPQILLITGLINPQAIRTVEMADIPVVLFVRGKRPPAETLELARQVGVAVLLSPYTMFDTCGILYDAGLKGLGQVPARFQ